MKGEVWGGLIPGLPYTAVDYVIIMKNVRHNERLNVQGERLNNQVKGAQFRTRDPKSDALPT